MRNATRLIVVLIVLALLPVQTIHAQQPINFPELTGPYQVGRMTYHFTGASLPTFAGDFCEGLASKIV